MQNMFWLLSTICFCYMLMTVSTQRIDGRYLRPNQPKCDSPSGCSSRDEPSDRDFKFNPDKLPPIDDYKSIAGSQDTNKDSKQGDGLKFDTDDYEHKVVRDEAGYRPHAESGYDKNPGIDYVPKPRDNPSTNLNPKEDAQHSPSGYNRKPVRGGNGGYNPRPVAGIDPDTFNPKPIDVGTDGYKPTPESGRDGYTSGSGGSNYRPKPSVTRDDPIYRPATGGGGGYRPKPAVDRDNHRPRPGSEGGYYKPGRPAEPSYPNKDLGGYEDPKDDDYIDGGGSNKDKDEGYGKPTPVVDIGNCICVPYYQCTDGHIVTDGAGIIDARKRPEPTEELPLDGKFKPPTCGPFHVCCNTPESSTVRPYEHRCGVRNPSGINSRILSPSNKGEADFGEWPWQAAVLKAEGKVNIFQCGGVLIDKFHVLTVAHCVFHLYKYNEYPLKVRLGEWDTQTTTEFLAHEDYKVAKIIVHPEYKNTSLWNDVAILKLEEAVLFAPHIDTVCLPKYDEVFAEQNCVVTGWGKDAYKGGTFSNIMKEVALEVIDNYKCEEMLRKTRLGRFFNLYEGFLCAGGEYGLDSCKGDGGGPLVCYRKDRSYALAGIVSWGIDCGQPGVPGVYVKIQKYVDWISKKTGIDLQDYWPKH